MDSETGELLWSDNLFRLFGLEPGSATPSVELVREMTHPEDRELQEREVERVRQGPTSHRYEYRIVRTDGSTRHLRSTLAKIDEQGKPHKILGTVQDFTDQRRTESEITALVAVSEAIVHWESFGQGVENLLRRLADALDWWSGFSGARRRGAGRARRLAQTEPRPGGRFRGGHPQAPDRPGPGASGQRMEIGNAHRIERSP